MKNCRRILLKCIGVTTCFVSAAGTARGHGPPYVSDTELASKPMIVVGWWKNGNTSGPAKAERKTDQVAERSWIIVDRVVVGDIKPGEYPFLRASDSFWDAKGKPTFGETEYYTPLDVDDVTKPNLWFISRSRGRDPKDRTEYLSSDTGRAVQPLSLEQFYLILRGGDRTEKISESLRSSDSLTLHRALRFVSGDIAPWPFNSSIMARIDDYRQKPQKALPQHAAEVGRLIESPALKVKGLAVATYAFLAGRTSVPSMRRLLSDPDPEVRAIAVGALAQNKDTESAGRFADAIRGFKDSSIGCAVIERLVAWGDVRMVPPLITFLDNDSSAGIYGNYYYIPAIQARKALRKVTGFSFPLEVKRSETAWRQASGMAISERRSKLMALLGDHAEPLSAEVFNVGGPPRVIVRNRSASDITITRRPPDIEMSYHRDYSQSFGGYSGIGRDIVASDFVTLYPGGKLTVPLPVSRETWRDYQFGPVNAHKLTFTYTSMGTQFGKKAWIGSLAVRFGTGWKRPHDRLVDVRERWPNGNLKVTGRTLNGLEIGIWRYYDRTGKLVRAEEHMKNGSLAGLNLEFLGKHQR